MSTVVCDLCHQPGAKELRNGGRAHPECRAAMNPDLTPQQQRRLGYLLAANRTLDAFNEGLIPAAPLDSKALRLVAREIPNGVL